MTGVVWSSLSSRIRCRVLAKVTGNLVMCGLLVTVASLPADAVTRANVAVPVEESAATADPVPPGALVDVDDPAVTGSARVKRAADVLTAAKVTLRQAQAVTAAARMAAADAATAATRARRSARDALADHEAAVVRLESAALGVYVRAGTVGMSSVVSATSPSDAARAVVYGNATAGSVATLTARAASAAQRARELQVRAAHHQVRADTGVARAERTERAATVALEAAQSALADTVSSVRAEVGRARAAASRVLGTAGDTAAALLGAGAQPAPVGPIADIPPRTAAAYVRAAEVVSTEDPACGISWSLIAGIGAVETKHGTFLGRHVDSEGRVTPAVFGPPLDGGRFKFVADTDRGALDGEPRFDRAVGPMQFLPGTWRSFGRDVDGDGAANPQDIDDAAAATGRYLCASRRGSPLTTPEGIYAAVLAYNRSSAYVRDVVGRAVAYEASARALQQSAPANGPVTSPDLAPSTP